MNRSLHCGYQFLLVVLSILSLAGCVHTDGLKPFTTDGCSYFPEGTHAHKDLWLPCCLAHDMSYWQGGTYKERLASDLVLRECVRDAGEPIIAQIMLGGVRITGSPYWPTQFRWGYGWPYPRGYKPLTLEEKAQITERLIQYRQSEKEKKE